MSETNSVVHVDTEGSGRSVAEIRLRHDADGTWYFEQSDHVGGRTRLSDSRWDSALAALKAFDHQGVAWRPWSTGPDEAEVG
jgi:hypothetical protein